MSNARTAALIGAAIIAMATPAWGEPVDLYESHSYSGMSASLALHGDIAGDVLTLNAAAPKSGLILDTEAGWPPYLVPNYYRDIKCFSEPCVKTAFYPSLNIVPSVPIWNIGLGGTIDIGAGVANLTATPPSEMIAEAHFLVNPDFVAWVDPGVPWYNYLTAVALAGSLNAAFYSTLPTLQVDMVGYWETVTLGAATAAFSQSGSDIQLDLGLGPTTLSGYITIDTDLTVSPSFVNAIGGWFEPWVEDQILGFLLDGFSADLGDQLDFSKEGYSQDCAGTKGTRYNEAVLEVACVITADMALAGTLDTAVDEPASLAVFGVGLVLLGAARRRRR